MNSLGKRLSSSLPTAGPVRILSAKSNVREGSLKSVVAKTGATRIMNLNGVAGEVMGDNEYAELPMFIHPVLNRSIIMKFNLQPGAEDKLAPRRFNSTKLIFPFDKNDINLGGQALFIDQPNFDGALSSLLDYTDLDIDRDLKVLRALDKLPTLDPFLIRESLSQQQIDVGRCYCMLSESDKDDMLAFVAGEIEALVKLCFREMEANDERAQHFAQLLLAEQNSVGLEPLRQIFRMKPAEFSDAMFCWKAFLYYRWRSRAVEPSLKDTVKAMRGLAAGRYEKADADQIAEAKDQLRMAVATAWWQVGQKLKLYDQAFAALTDRQKPDDFRAFLIHGSNLFMELGTRIGQMEQVVSLWDYRFGPSRIAELSADDILTGLRDLQQQMVPVGQAPALAVPA